MAVRPQHKKVPGECAGRLCQAAPVPSSAAVEPQPRRDVPLSGLHREEECDPNPHQVGFMGSPAVFICAQKLGQAMGETQSGGELHHGTP